MRRVASSADARAMALPNPTSSPTRSPRVDVHSLSHRRRARRWRLESRTSAGTREMRAFHSSRSLRRVRIDRARRSRAHSRRSREHSTDRDRPDRPVAQTRVRDAIEQDSQAATSGRWSRGPVRQEDHERAANARWGLGAHPWGTYALGLCAARREWNEIDDAKCESAVRVREKILTWNARDLFRSVVGSARDDAKV